MSYQKTQYGTVKNQELIDASVVTPVHVTFGMLATQDQPILATAITANATEIYSRSAPPKNVTGLYQGDQFKVNGEVQNVRIIADGVKTIWTEAEIPALINLFDVGNGVALAADEKLRLRNIVLANAIALTPKGNDIALAGADFRVINNAGTLELQVEKAGGGAYGNGTVLDVYMDKLNDQISTKTIAAGLLGIQQDGVTGDQFWTADQDALIHREPR